MATVIAGVSGAIGSALAEQYLDEPTAGPVIGLARQVHKVPERLRHHPGLHLVSWQADTPSSVADDPVIREVLASAGGITTLIYAAGLLHDADLTPEKRLDDLRQDSMLRAFQVNCIGFGLLVQILAPWFRGKQLTRVAAVSAKVGSIADNQQGGWYAYRCSKAALNMMVKNLAIELPRRYAPVACVAVHPGTTRSALSEPFGQSLAKLSVHKPEDTATNLFRILSGLGEGDNGRFINWDGQDLDW